MGCDEEGCNCSPNQGQYHHGNSQMKHNGCDCPGCTGQDPMEFVMMMWHKAAMEAMLEIKKDKIKVKMEAAWGDTVDKGADAMLETMSKIMAATMQKSSAEGELKGKLASIMAQAMNK